MSDPSAWATRVRRPRWSDPRLLVGLLLVVAATVLGGRLVASADDTTPVWSVTTEVRAGEPVEAADLVATRVALGSGTDRYLDAGSPPPAGVWTRDLAAGELVAASAVGDEAGEQTGSEVALDVAAGSVPGDLATGEVVDVWAVPPEGVDPGTAQAERVLAGVRVVQVSDPSAALAGNQRQVLVQTDVGQAELGRALAAVAAGEAVVVRVGG